MPRVYEWPATIAAAIAALPDVNAGLPAPDDKQFWSRVEARDDGALPLEALVYLARTAWAHGQHAAAERVFTAIWDRTNLQIAVYADRRHKQYLVGRMSAEDIVIEVFALLGARLRAAAGITFYEVAFMCGVRRLVCDQGRGLDRTRTESLDVVRAGDDEHTPRDVVDDNAIDPGRRLLDDERQSELENLVRGSLAELPPRARQTAALLMQWQSETAIAATLGVTTRMVRNYKAQIRVAMAGLA